MKETEGLSFICNGLGIILEDDKGNRVGYDRGENCLDNLKDLLRFLRRDDPQTREVFKQVCKWNIVSKNLIPIIENCQDDRSLVLNAVKVLVFLSMPVEPSSSDIPQQMEYLWELKASITSSVIIPVIVSLLEGPLENLEFESFTEDDWKLVQLVLSLFRNILAIQDISSLQKAAASANLFLSLRDRFLELLFQENVMDLIIVITQHVGGSRSYFRHDNLLLLEIFHYIFMSQDPELVAKARLRGSKGDGDAINDLKSIMEEEERKRKLSRLQSSIRHSQFSGTFTRKTMDGSNAVFKGNPASAPQNLLARSHKPNRGSAKKVVSEHGCLPSVKNNILEFLHDFVNQFLSTGYNVLMLSIHEDIEKEHHAIQNGDVVVFFKVAEFVTCFQYQKFLTSQPATENENFEVSADENVDNTFFKGNICGPIVASMNESMFQLVISRWRNAFDGLKETNNYKFLSAAGSLMKNMLRMLDLVLKLLPDDSKEPQTACILLYKLFYDQTDEGMTKFLLNLVKVFDTRKQPKSDLADLVEIIYVVVQLLENLEARGSLRVSKKSRKGRKKKATSDKDAANEPSDAHAIMPNEASTSCCQQQAELMATPKENTMSSTSDGKEDISIPHLVDEPGMPQSGEGNQGRDPLQTDKNKHDHIDDDLCCSSDSLSGDEQPATINEVDFDVSTLVSAFASCGIIQNLCWLLKFYRSNSLNTNKYVIWMLRKITEDLELSPMLYQLSLLRTFYDILVEQKSCPNKDHANIVDFLTRLVRNMLKKMKKQPLLFIEILFWKSRRECHYINAEYLLHELGGFKKRSSNLGNDLSNGEIGSSQSKEWARISIADALGEDEADVVITHELDYQNEGNSTENESEKISERKRKLVLSDDLETKVKDLYEKYKDDPNCSRLIAESLDPEGQVLAVQVSNKLKQLGLKVAPKKRMRAGGPFSAGSDQQKGEAVPNNKNGSEGSSPQQPKNTRKRVRAFSKDQEDMIKDLFEQFKGQKRCSYLIANALDPDNAFTAAQVTRKLNQLGLRVPHQKRSEANMQLRDEELDDPSVDVSDNETLISFRNRNKENDKFFGEKLPEENLEEVPNDSDDETLSSVFKKTKMLPPKSKNKRLITISTKGMIDGNSGFEVSNFDTERDGSYQSTDMDVPSDHHGWEHTTEVQAKGSTSGNLLGVSPVNLLGDLAHQQAEDELADSGDDRETDALLKSSINRRKLRMVIDLEEDD
ncbi:hypothetical protein SLA2020_102660 [Shorea laevis]